MIRNIFFIIWKTLQYIVVIIAAGVIVSFIAQLFLILLLPFLYVLAGGV